MGCADICRRGKAPFSQSVHRLPTPPPRRKEAQRVEGELDHGKAELIVRVVAELSVFLARPSVPFRRAKESTLAETETEKRRLSLYGRDMV